ncbi:hypothetical protein ACFL54_04245, partial [Planctomycetota bacterium]
MKDEQAKGIAIHYIKSNFFRAMHADGFWGGVAGNGKIHMSPYSERTPIPTRTWNEVTENNTLGMEIEGQRDGKVGIVREVDAEIIMDI